MQQVKPSGFLREQETLIYQSNRISPEMPGPQHAAARSPPHACAGRKCQVRSTPSLPLLSSLDCFVHLCYHVPVGLGTSGSPEERRFAYTVPFQLKRGGSEREPTLR